MKARVDPVPQSNGAVRFFCDPTFWAKNVVNLGIDSTLTKFIAETCFYSTLREKALLHQVKIFMNAF